MKQAHSQYEESESINSLSTDTFGQYTVSETGSPMKLKVNTDKGNSFFYNFDQIHWSSENGGYASSYVCTVSIKSWDSWVSLLGPEFGVNVPSISGNPVVYVVDGR